MSPIAISNNRYTDANTGIQCFGYRHPNVDSLIEALRLPTGGISGIADD